MLLADTHQQLDYISTSPLPAAPLPVAVAPLVHALASYHAFNITWFGAVALVVAITLNWRNSVTGYWINLVVVGADDLGLFLFLLRPGFLSFTEAGVGPSLFILAAFFSTLGMLSRTKPGTPPPSFLRDTA